MSLYLDEIDKHYILDDFENKLKRKSNCWSFKSVKSDEDKRARREVANTNERRRMQSINTGFENLRKLLPHCVENDKISKASILQTTAKYILELKARINCLENDLALSSKGSSPEVVDDNGATEPRDVKMSQLEINQSVASSYLSDLGSSSLSVATDNLSSSTMSLKSCDLDIALPVVDNSSIQECVIDNYQPQSTLDHLLAAVAQVERQEAMDTGTGNISRPSMVEFYEVMKPTISPYAEKIIQDVSAIHRSQSTPMTLGSIDQQPPQQYRPSKIAIPHKYLHRPEVVLCRSKNS